MTKKFAVFILTHGRPHNQLTVKTLQDLGYDGDLYLVVDDQDNTFDEYVKVWGADKVVVFHKDHFIKHTDTGLHNPVPKFAVFARNAIEFIARTMGYKTFMMLDDDITKLRVRLPVGNSLKSFQFNGNFNSILKMSVDFVLDCNIACMGLGFCNLYIGGVENFNKENPRQRLCAEAFIRNTSHPMLWRLNMVEDLITSIDAAMRGEVWFQFLPIQCEIKISEGVVEGGNSDVYRQLGMYRISFMPVIAYPSANAVKYGKKSWITTTTPDKCIPKIISSRYRKER
jgi:hypothetical protein